MNQPWQIPRELQSPPPRIVRRRGGIGAVIINALFVTPFLLIGLIGSIFAIAEPLILFFTPAIPAQVTDIYTTHGSKGGVTWHVKFVYRPNPADHSGKNSDECQVTQGEALALRVDQEMLVHDAALGTFNYCIIHRSAGNYVLYRVLLWILIGAWDALILSCIVAIRRKREKTISMVRDGQPVGGTIMGKSIVRSGKSITYRVKYQFMTPAPDSSRRESAMLIPRKRYNAANAGDAVTILYTPADECIIYEFCEFEAERF